MRGKCHGFQQFGISAGLFAVLAGDLFYYSGQGAVAAQFGAAGLQPVFLPVGRPSAGFVDGGIHFGQLLGRFDGRAERPSGLGQIRCVVCGGPGAWIAGLVQICRLSGPDHL